MEEQKEKEVDIISQIDQNVKMNVDAAKKAAEEIKKRNQDRRVDEMKTCLMKADYVRQLSLLSLRKSREEEKANKEFLSKLTKLNDELNQGKHDTASYDKAFKEARNAKKEAFRKASDMFDDYSRKLSQNFNDWDTWSWRRIALD